MLVSLWPRMAGVLLTGLLWLSSMPVLGLELTVSSTSVELGEYIDVGFTVQQSRVVVLVQNTSDFDVQMYDSFFNQPFHSTCFDNRVLRGPCVFQYRLTPRSAGRLSLPVFQVVGDTGRTSGKVLDSSNAVAVEVKDTGKGKKQQGRARAPQRGVSKGAPQAVTPNQPRSPELSVMGPDSSPVKAESLANLDDFSKYDIFILPQISKSQVWLYEPIRVDYWVYIKDGVQVHRVEAAELPEMPAFHKERLASNEQVEEVVGINQARYHRYLMARYVLLPLETGSVVLQPPHIQVSVMQMRVQEYPGVRFSVTNGSESVDAYGPPVLLDVAAAPQPGPDGFRPENVGSFVIEDLVNPSPAPVGSWQIVRFRVKGRGNLLSLSPPDLSTVAGLEVQEANVDRSLVTVSEQGVSGEIEVQLVARLKQDTTVEIPELALVYFDPEKGQYSRAVAGRVVFEASQSASPPPSSESGEGQAGILFGPWDRLEAPVGDRPLVSPVLALGLGLGSLAASALALILVVLVSAARNMNPGRQKMRQLLARAGTEMSQAAKAASAGREADCFASLARAIPLVLEARFGISVGSSTHGEVERQLIEQGVPAGLASEVRQELENAEFGRFSPSSLQASDAPESVKRTQAILKKLTRVGGSLVR